MTILASGVNLVCDHRGRVGGQRMVFYKIPRGGQNQTCKRVKDATIYGVPPPPWVFSLFIHTDHQGRVGGQRMVFYKIPPRGGGQNQTCKRVKDATIYGVPTGGQCTKGLSAYFFSPPSAAIQSVPSPGKSVFTPGGGSKIYS